MDPGTNGPTIPGSAILVRQDKDTLLVRLAGTWKIGLELPRAGEVLEQAGGNGAFRRAAFESSGLASWDSSLAAFLFAFLRECARRGIEADIGGLPPGARKLLGMAGISSTRDGTASLKPPRAVPARAREGKAAFLRSSLELLDFIGGAALSLVRLMAGRARFRLSEILHVLHAAGPAALPVIFLISSLVGVILAFVGAVQLKMFEAQLYIADVVGIAMAREMGPMMTAIIMMGRTGASFAAHLGTMETSEEIDALRTWGIDPMEFLVLP
ncbi:MAG: ABC transporter permease, partial [Desulfomonilia bacterium]